MPSVTGSFVNDVSTFVSNYKTLCVMTLGLAIAAYSVGNLAGRAIAWISESIGTTKKTDVIAQDLLPKTAQAGSISTKTVSAKDQARDLLASINNKTDRSSAYGMSIPLLGAAYLGDEELYTELKGAMMENLGKSEKPTTKDAWLYGRILVASLKMEDDTAVNEIIDKMESALQNGENDCFAAWAWGYLAIYYDEENADEYPDICESMIKSINSLASQNEEKGKDNVAWAIVMALQSFSSAEGYDDEYAKAIDQLKTFYEKPTVLEALQTIPGEDFRAWAISLTLHAAKQIGDHSLVAELSPAIDKEIEKSPSDADKMLALVVKTDQLIFQLTDPQRLGKTT